MKTREWRMTRQEFYEQIWSKPLKVLEKEIGLWYGQMLGIIRDYKIPQPPMGYWMKLAHGKLVQKPPLEPLPGNEDIVLSVYVPDERPYDEQQKQQSEDLLAEESSPERRVIVPNELTDAHPLVARAERSLRNASTNERQLLIPSAQNCLDIRVSKGALPRALRIMDALLKALEARGISVELTGEQKIPTQVVVLGETFGIGIEEKADRREKELTPQQKKEKERRPWMYSRQEYTYHPNGQFVLSIKEGRTDYGRQNWSDGKVQRVENLLNKFICALYRSAVTARSDRIQREIDEAKRLERQRRNEELRRLQQIERTRLENLEKHAELWKRSEVIRAYVAAVQERTDKDTFTYGDLPVTEWIDWALQQADRLDPLCVSPYSVLDEKVDSWW
ncbi:MAG: hypothetical protein IT365_01920 [Candidatus Hydrogenedentes bacterium]|nr:hypothetical protein [Candidatus Hydrogenedentota bacterium]